MWWVSSSHGSCSLGHARPNRAYRLTGAGAHRYDDLHVRKRNVTWVAVAAQNTDIFPGKEINLAGDQGLELVT